MGELPVETMPAARIRYRDDQPYSLDYGDIYHAADGAAEVARVFIEPCGVDELARERSRARPHRAVVRIGELGFGSGFNFVVAAERCLAAGVRLHFVSCEAHPIDAADFAAIAARRRAGHPLYQELADVYPPRLHGWHQRLLAGGRVSLNLWLGTAADLMAELCGRQHQPMDAWFLDGFAPDRNPALWEADLFRRLASVSGHDTRVATFTAAGRVRRGLAAAGFAMRRVDQRPHKRESLAGVFAGRRTAAAAGPAQPVTVIGGGLAGACAAWRLARAGCPVTVMTVEAAAGSAAPGSTMPATVAHARLLSDGSAVARLRCHAYLHAAAVLAGLPGFSPTGALQLAGGSRSSAAMRAVAQHYAASGSWLRWLEQDDAADAARWPVTGGGLHLPAAGVVNIPTLVAALLAHPGIEVIRARAHRPPADGPTVLACGPAVHEFPEARYLEVAPVQGQLDLVRMEPPALPLVGQGYLVPAGDGLVAAGSTYEHRPWDPEAASRSNLAQIAGHRYHWHSRCRGTRTVTSDRTAIAGPLFDAHGDPLPGLCVSTGHGSAGNVTAHLAAAVITARLTGDCPPLARPLEAALSPRRFRDRQARRGYRHNAAP